MQILQHAIGELIREASRLDGEVVSQGTGLSGHFVIVGEAKSQARASRSHEKRCRRAMKMPMTVFGKTPNEYRGIIKRNICNYNEEIFKEV